MDDHIRASDADRDRIAARLRDHFAEGRLTRGELDERITVALNAKTFGELRPIMADLPEPAPTPRPAQPAVRGAPPWVARRGPRVLPLVMLLLFVTLLSPAGGLLLVTIFNQLFVFWLSAGLAVLLTGGRARRPMHRNGPPGYTPRGPGQVHWL
jgi:hypothetical protein